MKERMDELSVKERKRICKKKKREKKRERKSRECALRHGSVCIKVRQTRSQIKHSVYRKAEEKLGLFFFRDSKTFSLFTFTSKFLL